MSFGDPAGDRQSEARPFGLLGSGAKEAIEYGRLGALRKKRSGAERAPEAVFAPITSWACQPPFFRNNNDVWTALELCADVELAAAKGL